MGGRPIRCTAILEDVRFICACPCHLADHDPHPGNACHYCGGLQVLSERLGLTCAALKKALARARARQRTAA